MPSIATLIRHGHLVLPGGKRTSSAELAGAVEFAMTHRESYDISAYVTDAAATFEQFNAALPFPAMWFEWPALSGNEWRGCIAFNCQDTVSTLLREVDPDTLMQAADCLASSELVPEIIRRYKSGGE